MPWAGTGLETVTVTESTAAWLIVSVASALTLCGPSADAVVSQSADQPSPSTVSMPIVALSTLNTTCVTPLSSLALAVRLPRGAALSGRILEESGAVGRGASVYVRGGALGLAVHMPPVLTDEQGRYEVRGIPAGKYTVTVLAPPRAPGQLHDLQFQPGERRKADITLRKARTLKGRVLDDRGRPVAGARVALRLPRLQSDLGTLTTHSNPDGRFRLVAGAGDKYELRVRRNGIAPLHRQVTWPAGELRIDVQSLGSISGRVALGDEETPARKYGVHVLPHGWEGPGTYWHTGPPYRATFDHAAFQFPNIPPGTYDVIVLASGRASRRIKGVRVSGGRDTTLDAKLVLEEAGRVEGKVFDASGKPMNNVVVTIEGPDGGRASGWGTRGITGSAGIYQLWLLHPGRCIVRARHGEREVTRAVTVTARAKLELDLRFD